MRVILLAVVAALVAGCASKHSAISGELPCLQAIEAETQTPPALSDVRMMNRLVAEGEKLIDSGKTANISDLQGQLNRDKCDVELPPKGDEVISAEELYARRRSSVLMVAAIYKCPKCGRRHAAIASGFLISRSGAFVTSHHVIAAKDRLAFVCMTADGRVLPVKSVLAGSRATDVAIGQIDPVDIDPAPLANRSTVGARVRVISHPDNRLYTLSEGIISRQYTVRRGAADVPVISITADYARGSSGGPVFDERGNVVALVSSTTSIYHQDGEGKPTHLQMVVKECAPIASVRKLLR